MIVTNSTLSQIDREAERRQVLTEVYKFLIRMTEKSKNRSGLPNLISKEEEKVEEPIIAQTDSFKEEILPHLDTEVSIRKTE